MFTFMHEADLKRRRFLVTATQVIGGLGIAAASVPFVGSMLPSSKALALGAPVEIDISLMQQSCEYLLGEQDFSAFRGSGCQSNSPWRNVHKANVYRRGNLVIFEITANAFLLHMVRNIVGSLLEVGTARQKPLWIQQLLIQGDRCKSAATAAPDGLYLVAVDYPARFGLPALAKGPVFLPAILDITEE